MEPIIDTIKRGIANGALRKNPNPEPDYGHPRGTEQCVRIYANGDIRTTYWRKAEVADWLAYNKLYRFGNALFVNGECKQNGYLSDGLCAEISEVIREYNLNVVQ